MIVNMVGMGSPVVVAVRLVKHGGVYGSRSRTSMVAMYCSNGVLSEKFKV